MDSLLVAKLPPISRTSESPAFPSEKCRRHPQTLVDRTIDTLLRSWKAFDPDPEASAIETWVDLGLPRHLARSLVAVSVALLSEPGHAGDA